MIGLNETNRKHIIVGSGSFSHAHIRVLNDFNIKQIILLRKSKWNKETTQYFKNTHPDIDFTFADSAKYNNSIVHIVTPSNTHLSVLAQCKSAKQILLEKPSVLYNTEVDFKNSNKLYQLPIYQNDWLSQIQNYRKSKNQPKNIKFVFDVKNKNQIDHVTEIWSHAINFLSLWFEPNCLIYIEKMFKDSTTSFVKVTLDNHTVLEIHTSNGHVNKSQWSLSVDNESFNSDQFGGKLFSDVIKNLLNNDQPLTNWYKSSWLIHKFRLLSFPEMFDYQYHKYCKHIK